MASLRPNSNKGHALGSSDKKWSTLHTGDIQAETMTTSGNVEIQGNLTVAGTQTVLSVTTVEATDPLIKLAKDNSAADSIDIGFYGRSYNGAADEYHGLARDADDSKFYLFEGLGTEPSSTMPDVSGNTATLVANVEGALTGNADTASTLETARDISLSGDVAGSVSFNGSSNVDIAATIQALSVENSMLAGSIADGKLAQDYIQVGEVDDSSVEWTGTQLQVKALGITNAMLAGSIENAKLSNSSVSFGGVSVALGASDATPAFDLSDATNYPTAQLVGSVSDGQLAQDYVQITEVDGSSIEWDGVGSHLQVKALGITNAMLAGSIENAKLSNSSVSLGGVSVSLGGSDATPAFDLSDATNYPTAQLVGTITNAQLAGSIENSKLSNSSITFGDGVNSTAASLGGSVVFQGTDDQIEVGESAGTFTFSLPATIDVNTSANAATATALQTSRNFSIGSGPVQAAAVSFDGTGNVSLTSSIANDQITNAMLANEKLVFQVDGVDYDRVLGSTIKFAASNLDIAYSAVDNQITYTLPATIGSDTTGNAATATALETARNFSISSGPVVATAVSFDGTGNVALTSSIGNDEITNAMLENPGLEIKLAGVSQETIELGDFLDFSGTASQVSIAYDSVNNDLTFSLPATINVDTSGNAASATSLETSRDIQLTGDVVGTASFDGTANASISTTISTGAVDNVMLANSSITVSDTSNSEAISLGDTLYFGGTSSEVDVAYDSGLNKFTFGLPNNVSITTNLDVGSALSVGGNITATGNISAAGLTATGANITFADNLIEFGVNNTDLEDIGFYGQRGDGIGGSNGFAGFAFDESVDKFIAFTSTGEPTTTVGTHTKADMEIGALTTSEVDCSGAVAGQIQLEGAAPADSGSSGTQGQIRFDANYIYICTATDTWKRVALSSY